MDFFSDVFSIIVINKDEWVFIVWKDFFDYEVGYIFGSFVFDWECFWIFIVDIDKIYNIVVF